MSGGNSSQITAQAYSTFLIDVSAVAYATEVLNLSVNGTMYLLGTTVSADHFASQEKQYSVYAPTSGSAATVGIGIVQDSVDPTTGLLADLYVDSISVNGSLSNLNGVETPAGQASTTVSISPSNQTYQTNDQYLPLDGTAAPGQVVNAYLVSGNSQVLIGSSVADAAGNWTLVPTAPLSIGGNTVTVEAGSAVAQATNTVTLTIDVSGSPPVAPTINSFSSEPIYLTNTPNILLSGTGPANLEIVLYSATSAGSQIIATTYANSLGLWSVSLSSSVSSGINQLTAVSVDQSGQESPGSQPYIIDYQPTPIAGSSLSLTNSISDINIYNQSATSCFDGIGISDPGLNGLVTISISDSLTTMGVLVNAITNTVYSSTNPAVFRGSVAAAQAWLSNIAFQPSAGAYGSTLLSVTVADGTSTATTSIEVALNTFESYLNPEAVTSGTTGFPFGNFSIQQALNDPVVFAGGIDNITTDGNTANTALLQSTGRASLEIQAVGLGTYSNDAFSNPTAGVVDTTNAASSQLPGVIQDFSSSGAGIVELFLTNTATIPEADWNEPIGNTPWQAELQALNWHPAEATLNLNTGETGYVTGQDMADALALEAEAHANGISLVLPIITPNGSDLRGNPATDPSWSDAITLMREMGGVAIDISPSDFLVHGTTEADVLSYQHTIEELIQYANANGLVSAVMVSPYNNSDSTMPAGWVPQFWADPSFLASTQDVVSILANAGALPQQWIVENYGLSGYETQIGSDLSAETINGVATWLAQYAPVAPPSSLLYGLDTPAGPTFTATVSLSSGSGATLSSATGILSSDATSVTFTGSATTIEQDVQNVAVITPGDLSGNVQASVALTDGGYSTQQTVELQVIAPYRFSSGQLSITNGNPSNDAPTGTLILGSGLTPANLWITRAGSDLLIEVIGSSDAVDVKGWFSAAYFQLSSLQLADGSSISSSAITALANAGSVYQTQNPTFIPGSAAQGPSDPQLLSALNTGWSRTILSNTANGMLAGSYGNNTLTVSGNDERVIPGSGIETINLEGKDESVASIDGSGTVVNGASGGDSVSLASGASASINGSGGAVAINGTGIALFASNVGITTVVGASLNLTGNYNTVGLGALSYVGLMGGTANVVNNDDIGSSVNLMSDTFASINGTNGYIGICGIDITVTASGESVGTVSGASFYIGGDGNYVTLGGNTSVEASGNYDNIIATTNDTIVQSGTTGDRIKIRGTSIAVSVSGASISTQPAKSFTLTGDGNAVFLGEDTYVGLNGGSGNVVSADNPGNTVNLMTNAAATVIGSGGYVGICGTNIVVYVSFESISTVMGAAFTVTGNTNTIGLGTSAYVGLNGGSGNVVNNDGAGAAVNLMTNASAAVNGSGGYIGICGTNITLNASNETLSTIAGAAFTLIGSGNTIGLGPSSSVALNGGSGNVVNNDNAGASVSLISNASATVNGSGGSVAVSGTNVTLTTSNETVATVARAALSLVGSGNTVGLGPSAYVGLNGGSGNIVNNDGAGAAVNLMTNASATVNGSGGYIGICGTNITLTASSESLLTVASAAFTLTGSGNTVGLGSSSYVGLNGGSGNVVNNDGSGCAVNLMTNASATVNGSGGYIGICGTNIILAASGESLSTIASAAFTLTGSNNTIGLGSSSSVVLNGGSGNVVNNSTPGTAVNLLSSASATVNGSGGSVEVSGTNATLSASNESVTITGVASAYLAGNNDIISVGAGASVSVNGTNNSLMVAGGTGQSTTIFAVGGSDTVLCGSGKLAFLQGPAVSSVTLGAGAVTFDITAGTAGGSLSIYDFVPKSDVIHLSGYQGSGISSETYVGGATHIVLSDNTQITLFGVNTSQHIFG